MAKIKLERTTPPTGSVEFSRNPSKGDYERITEYLQPKDLAGGGDLYIYDKGDDPKSYKTLRWKNISSADLANFMAFLNAVKGSKYNFTFTDYDSATYTARIMNSNDIRSSPVAHERESLTVELLIES